LRPRAPRSLATVIALSLTRRRAPDAPAWPLACHPRINPECPRPTRWRPGSSDRCFGSD
jgi:hypothetical protein